VSKVFHNNTIHSAQHIFDLSVHPYQLQSIAITKDLRMFFNKHLTSSIKFWDYPSDSKWFYHVLVNKDIKKFNLVPNYSCKLLWDFNKKEKYNIIIKNWQIKFQASDFKRH